MINFSGKTKFFMKSTPTDMRKGYDGLASIVRDVMGRNPRNYNEAFVFTQRIIARLKSCTTILMDGYSVRNGLLMVSSLSLSLRNVKQPMSYQSKL